MGARTLNNFGFTLCSTERLALILALSPLGACPLSGAEYIVRHYKLVRLQVEFSNLHESNRLGNSAGG